MMKMALTVILIVLLVFLLFQQLLTLLEIQAVMQLVHGLKI
jgi:uncharacterized membrane protein